MSNSHPAPVARRRSRSLVRIVLVLAAAALVAVVVFRGLGDSSTTWTSSSGVAETVVHQLRDGLRSDAPGNLPRDHRGRLGVEDGEVPDGATVFDDKYPAVSKLDPALLDALRRAAKDASGSGVEFDVNSGWRAPAYQERLLDQAVAKYGSREEAARWVATPDTSPHVSGQAVDLGTAAASWLSDRGAGYGLCQIYANEPWHFELRPDAVDHGCPALYADPTQDPRMQR